MTLQVGEVIEGKYRIVRQLGAGAMGEVYEGENLRIKRRVAIKVLLPQVATKDDVVKRFEHEAQAAGRIGSEHIVEVLDLGRLPDSSLFMVMEFLEGMTLSDRIQQHGRLTPQQVSPLIQQLLTGLEAAHAARIIHRDLKPDNVFLLTEHAGQRDFVKILDFGVSKFNPLSGDDNMRMTATGAVMGTPYYMAPEQAKGARDIDERSDLYSVGVILYQCITGQVPFDAHTFNELIFKIVLETPPPATTFVPNLDPNFDRLVQRAMAREPEDRFPSAASMRDALSVWLHTGRVEGRRSITPPPTSQTRVPATAEPAPISSDQAPTMYAGQSPLHAAAGHGHQADNLIPEAEPESITRPHYVDTQGHPHHQVAYSEVGYQSAPGSAPSGYVDWEDRISSVPGVPRRSNTGIIIAIVVTAMLAAAVTVFIVFGREDGATAQETDKARTAEPAPSTEKPTETEGEPEAAKGADEAAENAEGATDEQGAAGEVEALSKTPAARSAAKKTAPSRPRPLKSKRKTTSPSPKPQTAKSKPPSTKPWAPPKPARRSKPSPATPGRTIATEL